MKCKRLIDAARMDYLKHHGLSARLLYYVDKHTSLENILLLAMADSTACDSGSDASTC